MIESVVVNHLHLMYLSIIILSLFLPSLLCCGDNKTHKIVEFYTTKEFHGISDLGIAVINNEIEKIADLIGKCKYLNGVFSRSWVSPIFFFDFFA